MAFISRAAALAALGLVFGMAFAFTPARAGTPAQTLPNEHTARLVGLCQLWGAIKYFHPYLADTSVHGEINWDDALVETIPQVNAARSPQEYHDALAGMLARLHDPATRVLPLSPVNPKPAQTPPKLPALTLEPDGIGIVSLTHYEDLGTAEAAEALQKALANASKAKALVFDLRRDAVPDVSLNSDIGASFLSDMLSNLASSLLANDVPMATTRHRVHSGYAPQIPPNSGYYSAWVTEAGGTLSANGSADGGPDLTKMPTVLLVNNSLPSDAQTLVASLQAAGRAQVIAEGVAGDYGALPGYQTTLADGIQVVMSTDELVSPNGSAGFHPDSYATGDAAASSAAKALLNAPPVSSVPASSVPPVSSYSAEPVEKAYSKMPYPSVEYRLLALFRLWNVIHYFYPYLSLMDTPWDEVLVQFIPQMEAAKDAPSYALTVARLVQHLDDSHGALYGRTLNDVLGRFQPPLVLDVVQGQTVITGLPAGKPSGLRVGNVLMKIDGETTAARRARLAPLFAASTPQALQDVLSFALMRGAENSVARLTIEDAQGKKRTVTLARTVRYAEPPARPLPVYGVLPSGFGYIDLTRLTPDQVDAAMQRIRKTRALIIDIRGYPNGTIFSLASYFTRKTVTVALFDNPQPQSPDDLSVNRFEQKIDPTPKGFYGGKVVVLIDAHAISQSEHSCLFLEATAHAKFIGTPTDGANGDVTNTVLPGGFLVNFSGHGVRHADGRRLQRVGIQPDVRIAPTLAGLRAGRDEVLDAAVDYLRRTPGQ